MHPPFGFALFYLRSVAPRSSYVDKVTGAKTAGVSTGQIYWGAVPFVVIQMVMVGVVIAFPQLVMHYKGAPVDTSNVTITLPQMPGGGLGGGIGGGLGGGLGAPGGIGGLGGAPAPATPAPGAAAPGIGSPNLGTPNLGTPSLGTPNLGAPSLGTPTPGAPAIGQPNLGGPAPAN